jgi:hypothetical protein
MRLHVAVAECYSFGCRGGRGAQYGSHAAAKRGRIEFFFVLNQQLAATRAGSTKVSNEGVRKFTLRFAGEHLELPMCKLLLT